MLTGVTTRFIGVVNATPVLEKILARRWVASLHYSDQVTKNTGNVNYAVLKHRIRHN
tara:strand:+ start:141 stop:311 length:171 start_codon:yes stop_codon:yes gene_type:complete